MDFVMQTYMQEEPMMVMVGLKGNPSPAMVHLVYSSLKQGMTMLVVDACNSCLAGACLNGDVPPSEAKDLERIAECCDTPPSSDLVKFGAFVAKESNIWANYCVPSVFTCEYLAVDPKYRGKGFAARLLAESWVLARDLGYKVLRVDASNEYTSRVCQKFGWQCVYSIPYQRYHDQGRFVFTNVKEPHTVFRIYCDYINCYSSYFPQACKKT